jgi:hypothetical protein
MWNYRTLINSQLHLLSTTAVLAEDPNAEINKRIRDRLTWYPPYFAFDEACSYILFPFSISSYIDDNEAKADCDSAFKLAKKLTSRKKRCNVVFITRQIEDSSALDRFKFIQNYSVLQADIDPPLLQTSKIPPSKYSARLISQPLKYLSKSTHLQGNIGKILKSFANNCIQNKLAREEEYNAIKELIDKIISNDKRFKLDTHSIHFVETIEKLFSESNVKLRDHYFHACNTMLIGFEIIDKFYTDFQNASTVYGHDINIEFTWAITSLYHDIGYPASLHGSIIGEAYDCQEDKPFTEACAMRDRQFIWESKHAKGAKILDHLFSHVTTHPRTPWAYDGFARESFSSHFHTSLQTAFIERGTHGAQGALMLTGFIDKTISKIKDAPDREYLYRHLGLSAMSILFHDPQVRNIFRKNGIPSVRLADFPFSGLLTYVDAIQDDRRDISGLVSRPDIFKDVISVKGVISARLNKRAMAESIRVKILNQLQEALEFFKRNGIAFAIPLELEGAI